MMAQILDNLTRFIAGLHSKLIELKIYVVKFVYRIFERVPSKVDNRLQTKTPNKRKLCTRYLTHLESMFLHFRFGCVLSMI